MNQPLCIVSKQMQLEGEHYYIRQWVERAAEVGATAGSNKQRAKVSFGNISS